MTLTILEQEIHEQPEVIERLLEREGERVREIAAALEGKFKYILIAARGSSDNAARYAQYLLGAHNRLQVALATPSLYTAYQTPPNLDGALVIGISQSGRSPDIVSVIEEGRRQHRPTLVITNDPASPLAAAADHVIELGTGPERAVAATKTYTSSLAALALFSAHLLEREGGQSRGLLQKLHQLPGLMDSAIQSFTPVGGRVERYRYMEHCVVLGRGFNYATAFEVALKIKELTGTIAEPYSTADFLHGPIAMIRRGFPVLAVSVGGAVLPDLQTLQQRLAELRAEFLLISDQPGLLAHAHLALPIPSGMEEWLSPLIAVLPGQLFGLRLAQARGLNPDQPEGIHKVTETW